jgi:hypothetical protein
MKVIEDSFGSRHDIDLPDNLLAARIDERALAILEKAYAIGYDCLPWRLADDTLTLLLPEDIDEDRWEELALNVSLVLAVCHEADQLLCRSSGLSSKEHRNAIDFLYRRVDSNISCVNMFEFVCPMQWQSLGETLDPYTRHCNQCKRDVHLVANEQEFQNRAQTGDCVAYVPPSAYPTPIDFGFPEQLPQRIMAGAPMPPQFFNDVPPLTQPPETRPPDTQPSFDTLLDDLLSNEPLVEETPPREKEVAPDEPRPERGAWWNPLNLFKKKK